MPSDCVPAAYGTNRWGISRWQIGNAARLKAASLRSFGLDLLGFMRFRICIFLTALSVAGFFLTSPASMAPLFMLIPASFFLIANGYSLNSYADVKEDVANGRNVSRFAGRRSGLLISSGFSVIGLAFCAFLGLLPTLAYLLLFAIGIFYSLLKLKNVFPIKNLYTGFGLPLLVVIGATVNAPFSLALLLYYLLFSVFLTTVSLISDLRDFQGDKETGIRTVPVVLGYETARRLIYALVLVFLALVMLFDVRALALLALASFVMMFEIYRDFPLRAHTIGGYSMVALAVIMALFA